MSEPRAARQNPNWYPRDDMFIPDWDIRDGRPEEDIKVVADSLQEEGQVVPVLLGQETDQGREIVDGVHRYLAAKRIGWNRLDAIMLSDDRDTYTDGVVANLGRVQLSNHDKLNIVSYLQNTTDWTQRKMANKVGIGEPTVSRYLQVLNGYNEIRKMYQTGSLPLKAAVAMNDIPDRDEAVACAEDGIRRGLNQRELIATAKNRAAEVATREGEGGASEALKAKQAREQARETKSIQEAQAAQAAPQPAAPGPSQDAIQEGHEQQVQEAQPDHDGPVCQGCGGPREQDTTTRLVLPDPIAAEAGVKEYELCGTCGTAVLRFMAKLQEQAPSQ